MNPQEAKILLSAYPEYHNTAKGDITEVNNTALAILESIPAKSIKWDQVSKDHAAKERFLMAAAALNIGEIYNQNQEAWNH